MMSLSHIGCVVSSMKYNRCLPKVLFHPSLLKEFTDQMARKAWNSHQSRNLKLGDAIINLVNYVKKHLSHCLDRTLMCF